MDILIDEKATKKYVHRLLILYTGCDKDRELQIQEIQFENKTMMYFLYMSKLPSTGFAVYLPDSKVINFYQKNGNNVKKFFMPDGFEEIEK